MTLGGSRPEPDRDEALPVATRVGAGGGVARRAGPWEPLRVARSLSSVGRRGHLHPEWVSRIEPSVLFSRCAHGMSVAETPELARNGARFSRRRRLVGVWPDSIQVSGRPVGVGDVRVDDGEIGNRAWPFCVGFEPGSYIGGGRSGGIGRRGRRWPGALVGSVPCSTDRSLSMSSRRFLSACGREGGRGARWKGHLVSLVYGAVDA